MTCSFAGVHYNRTEAVSRARKVTMHYSEFRFGLKKLKYYLKVTFADGIGPLEPEHVPLVE
jgi:hypothetical protein